MILEKIRNWLFWTIDCINGKPIRSHLDDIEYIISCTPESGVNEKINERCNNLIKHAVKSTKFYAKYSELQSLNDFPVLNKNILRDNYEDFISSEYSLKELNPVYTSGSTGTPLRIFQDRRKKLRNTADTIYFSERIGFRVGSRLYYLKLWKNNTKNKFIAWFQNIVMIDVYRFPNEARASMIRRLLVDKSTIGIMGYSSALESICRYMDSIQSVPINGKVKSIIAISENLNEYTKESLRKYFNANVVSRYSNMENGILAQQDAIGRNNSEFLINNASYHIEILNLNEDTPVKDGELGRIVITDYFNFGMPIIRYDTGDMGVMQTRKISGISTKLLGKVEGRKIDMIQDTSGNFLSTYVFWSLMKSKVDIKQFQFIQKGLKKYTLRLNCKNPYHSERVLLDEYQRVLGLDAKIEIEYVSNIPLLSSGKRKILINELH